ncbi:MAG: metal ABC transporter permease, partial [Candidatus Aminicenantales bacterium]
IAALLVIPAAAGLQLASSFRKAVILSSFMAVLSVVVGLLVSFSLDFPASGTIVLMSFLIFGLCYAVKKEKKFF